MYLYAYVYTFICILSFMITLIVATTVSPSLISTVMVNSIPSQPSVSPIMQSLNMDNSQENISGASQPSSCVTIVSYTHTTVSSSSVTSLNVVECLTTSSSVVTSISGQDVYQADKDDCTVTTISGMKMYT